MATTTATITAKATANAIVVMDGVPTTTRPSMAITTVEPANTTAPPAVASARPMDSTTSIPATRCSRCRDMMNRA